MTSTDPDTLDAPGEDPEVDRLDDCEPFKTLKSALDRAEDRARRSNVDWYVLVIHGYTVVNGTLGRSPFPQRKLTAPRTTRRSSKERLH